MAHYLLLTDWTIKKCAYKTALIKVSGGSFCILVTLLAIHYPNFPKLTQDMIFADLSVSGILWVMLLATSFFFIKTWQILKEDLEIPR